MLKLVLIVGVQNKGLKMRLHTITFPVGDWSDDGHGKCDYFIVKSNKSVEELEKIHNSAKEKLGFDIGEICEDYEDFKLSKEIFDNLVKVGFPIMSKEYTEYFDYFENSEEIEGMYMSTETLFNLWIGILKFLGENVEIKLIKSDLFCNVNTPGYGCHY